MVCIALTISNKPGDGLTSNSSNVSGSHRVNWSALQQIFLEDESELDVLMILDCCKAGSSVRAPISSSCNDSTVFVLAACGFDASAPLSGDVTYTANLIATLAEEATIRTGRTVVYIAAAVYDRLQRLVLPNGACGVSSVSYVLRESSRVMKLQGQPKLVRWAAQLQHTVYSPTPSVIELGQQLPPVLTLQEGMQTEYPNQHQMEMEQPNQEHMQSQPSGKYMLSALDRPARTKRKTKRKTERKGTTPLKDLLCVLPGFFFACLCFPWYLHRRRRACANEEKIGSCPITPIWQGGAFGMSWPPAVSTRWQLILARLSYPDMFVGWDSIIVPSENTFEPIFSDGQFDHWVNSPDEHLIVIVGRAGSGKSTITKMLAGSARITRSAFINHTVAHSFRNSGIPLQGNVDGLLRSLLLQISFRLPSLFSFWGTDLLDHSFFTREQLMKVMKIALLDVSDQGLCVFLDGLNMCDARDFVHLTEILDMLQTAHIKVCATIRPSPRFLEHFESLNTSHIYMEDVTRKDMTAYVDRAVSRLELRKWDREQLLLLVQHLVDRSKGVFLWALMATKQLCRDLESHQPMAHLRENITALPEGIVECHNHILNEMSPALRRQTACTFSLLLAAQVKIITLTGVSYHPALTTLAIWFAYEVEKLPYAVLKSPSLHPDEARWIARKEMPRQLAIVTGHLVEASPGESERMDHFPLISYIDQSVRYFAEDQELSEIMSRDLPPNYDANICALGSAVLQLTYFLHDDLVVHGIYDLPIWPIAEQAMTYAARVPKTHRKRLVSYLDELDRVMTLEMNEWPHESGQCHWASLLPLDQLRHDKWQDNMMSVATEHAIMPYVSEKLSTHPDSIWKAGRPLLDYAIFPNRQCAHQYDDTRVELVRLLLDHGARFNGMAEVRQIYDRFNKEYEKTLHRHLTNGAIVEKLRFLAEIKPMIEDYAGGSSSAGPVSNF